MPPSVSRSVCMSRWASHLWETTSSTWSLIAVISLLLLCIGNWSSHHRVEMVGMVVSRNTIGSIWSWTGCDDNSASR